MATEPSLPPERRLGLSTRLYYGVGSVAFGVKDNGFTFFLAFFYTQVIGLPSATVGLAIMIALFLDALIDPVIGQLSDNLRSRWGRRHPFMYLSAVPVAASYLLLWNPPSGWSSTALLAYLVVTSILIRSFISLYEIPSAALSAELTTDYNERTRLLSYRYLFGWLGGLTMYVLATGVFLRSDAGGAAGTLNRSGYEAYGWVAAGLMLVTILVSAIGTHRHIPSLSQPAHKRITLKQFVGEMFATLSHRTFLFVLSASFFNAMALGLGFSITLYLVTYFYQFSSAQAATLGISSLLAAVFAFWLAPRISARMDKKPVTIALILAAMLTSAAPIVLRLTGAFPENGAPLLFWLVFGFNTISSGLGITGQILFSSMIADVVEDSELHTGRRQEGLFFAAAAFVNKAVSGAGIFATAFIVSAIALPQGVAPDAVPPETIRALGLIFVPTTAVLYIAAAVLLLGYGITRRSHHETLRQLAERATSHASPRPVVQR
jgi:glycoside/pentoside/hexuronide:cation symporter, GPH family